MYLHQLLQELSVPQQTQIKSEHGKAMAYVWGRQDAGEGPQNTERSERFAIAWAAYEKDWLLEKVWWKPNLRDAYETWSRSRVIDPESLTCGTLYQ